MAKYKTLRAANLARQIEWDTGGNIDLSYSGNELAGEAGELIQAAVDLMNGSENRIALKEEIGDVIICCDLIAMRVQQPLDTSDPVDRGCRVDLDSPDGLSFIKDQLIDLALEVGNVSNTVKKQERARFGMVGAKGSLEDMMRNLTEIVGVVYRIGESFGVDAGECVADKFNLTSSKYGLETKLVY